MSTATYVREAVGSFKGDARVYQLDPPLDGIEFVVSSAVDLSAYHVFPGDSDSETMIFESDGYTVTSYSDLAVVRYISHEDALEVLGYELVEEDSK